MEFPRLSLRHNATVPDIIVATAVPVHGHVCNIYIYTAAERKLRICIFLCDVNMSVHVQWLVKMSQHFCMKQLYSLKSN